MFLPKLLTLSKEERICSRKQVESLFNEKGNRVLSLYPLRVVYKFEKQCDDQAAKAQMMVSVSKRHFKHAVMRNRVKRQLREAYRKNKYIVVEKMSLKGGLLLMAFIWLADNLYETRDVEQCMKGILTRLSEHL